MSALLRLRAGTASADFPGAPASVTAPVVGSSLIDVWNLQKTGAVGPRYAYSNGAWDTTYSELPLGDPGAVYPATPVDPYLQGLGCVYDNYGNLFFPLGTSGSIVVEKYDFTGAPGLDFNGDGITVVVRDCKNPAVSDNKDINNSGKSDYTTSLTITYCILDTVTWNLYSIVDFELSYSRVKNQVNTLGFAGGVSITHKYGLNIHHNFITGGGCAPSGGTHVEYWQHIIDPGSPGTGSYTYFRYNMVDFTQDGQSDVRVLANGWTGDWTGCLSEGGACPIDIANNIVKGLDTADANASYPLHVNYFVSYDDPNVTAGFTLTNNAISWGHQAFTGKQVAGSLKPTISGNRVFATNVAVTLSDLG